MRNALIIGRRMVKCKNRCTILVLGSLVTTMRDAILNGLGKARRAIGTLVILGNILRNFTIRIIATLSHNVTCRRGHIVNTSTIRKQKRVNALNGLLIGLLHFKNIIANGGNGIKMSIIRIVTRRLR